MRKLIIVALALSFCLSASSAFALKIGVVNLPEVMTTSKKAKKAQGKLNRILSKKQKTIDAKKKKIMQMETALKNPSAVDTPERRRKALMAYQQAVQAIQQEMMQHQQELLKKEKAIMGPVLKKLRNVLDAYAKEKGFDLIMAKGDRGVLFNTKALDVSGEIAKRMDK